MEHVKDRSEFIENHIGESVGARTEELQSFHDLGPPDLSHSVRNNGSKDIGAYQFVSGVDASSSASVAAYLSDVLNHVPKGSKFLRAMYCCYNAFSRVDVRITVKIPGGVEYFAVDDQGSRHDISPKMWTETYLSGVLRAILYSNEESFRVSGYVRLNPIPNLENESKFFAAIETLFFEEGPTLGSKPEVQIATVVNNHLTNALGKYINAYGSYVRAVELFEKLREKDNKVDVLLAQTRIDMDNDIEGMTILCDNLLLDPLDHEMHLAQAKFLASRGRDDLALACAKRAVDAAPSEFTTWAALTDAYISVGDYEAALLTLNSCPMYTFHGFDNHQMPEPAKTSMPPPSDTPPDLLEDPDIRNQEADRFLSTLPAPILQGTFATAYKLLTKINSALGWDNFLKCRSDVFVMEEEYRNEKADSKGSRLQEQLEQNIGNSNCSNPPIFMVTDADLPETPNPTKPGSLSEANDKPNVLADDKDSMAADETVNGRPLKHTLQHKRLCERWLDNLFMVLYEDLRVYTIWQTERAQHRSENAPYSKTTHEWEILGAVAERLGHREEAIDAFLHATEKHFSFRSEQTLIKVYDQRRMTKELLATILKFIGWERRWYSEFSFDVIERLRRTIETEGFVKTKSILSTGNPVIIKFVSDKYLDLAQKFKWYGWDA